MLRTPFGRKPPTPFRPQVERLDDRINPTSLPVLPSIAFAESQTVAAGTAPVATAVGDFNGDGKADVAVLNGSAATVSILLNTTAAGAAAPTFAAPQAHALTPGMTARAMAVGELNLDGRPDLVVVGQSGVDGIVIGLMNTTASGASRPSFSASDATFSGGAPTTVTLGDFDGDGRPDIVTNNSTSATNSVLVALNKTPLTGTVFTLAPWQTFAGGPNPNALAVGDLNRDGRLDLVVTNADAELGRVLLNQSPPEVDTLAFYSVLFETGVAHPTSVAVTDYDRDGIPDLAVAGAYANGTGAVAVLISGDLPGVVLNLGVPSSYAVGTGPVSLVVGDFNRDGRADLAVADSAGGTVSVLQSRIPVPTFLLMADTFTRTTYAVGANPVGLAMADFDRNGQPDLVAANGGDATVSVLRNTSRTAGYAAVLGQFGSALWSGSSAAGTGWSQVHQGVELFAAGVNGGYAVSGRTGVESSGLLIASVPATALAVDPQGNVWASFAGAGVAVFRRPAGNRSAVATGTWAGLPGTAATADRLAVSANGDVFANFVGYGVYRYRSHTGWQQINGHEATSLNVDAHGSVVANFAGFGLAQYIPYAHGWRLLSATTAPAVTVDASGTVFASFTGSGGVHRWSAVTGTWETVAASAPAKALATDSTGNVYLGSTGFGLWKFVPGLGWRQHRAHDSETSDIVTLGVF